jgi:PAS domain S-box-containing protein
MTLDTILYAASLLLQLAAFGFALHMALHAARPGAWAFMSLAFFGMVIFRVVGLLTINPAATWYVNPGNFRHFSAISSLAVSGFLFASLFAIRQISLEGREATLAKRESEARLQLGLKAGNTGTWEWDILRNRVTWSDSIYKFHGLQPGQFGGTVEDFTELIHPDDRERVATAIQLAVESDAAYQLEYRALHPDGAIRWIATTGLIHRDPRGKAVRMLGAASDITDRKHAEEAIRQSEGRHGAILQSALDCIVTMDHEGKVVEWNPAAERTFGYTRAESVGRHMAELIIPPPLRKSHRRGLDHYLETGEGPVLGKRLELTAVRKDGSEFPIELSISRIPIDGPPMFTGQLRDISDRKRSEEALRESEERLRLGLDAGSTGTWDWDIVTNRITWSERVYEFHGVKAGEFNGGVEDFSKLVHPDDAPRVTQLIQDSIENRTPYTAEFRVVHPDGQVHWISTNGKVYYAPDGRPLRMLGATIDVTARKSAEAERDRLLESERAARSEAERASRMKDEFLATLSHELRTPLNAILGWSQILRSGGTTEEDQQQGLETIERNARAQTQIIEDLLDMSRIISGKIRLDVQPVDLVGVIRAAVETVTPAAMAKEIRLQPVLDPMAGSVSGDPNRLQQIFWNLLFNAIKFTAKGGRVQVLLERVNSHLEISVIDSGQGIEPEFLPHVFDRFRQADASTTRKHGGLGLGLAIVKQLVELHGGTVRANSKGEGKGATFIVTLPVTPIQLSTESHPDRRHPTAPGGNGSSDPCTDLEGVRVLVVDDEPDARSLMKRLLEDCKAIVTLAATATEALDLLAREPVDVLVSDIGMPKEDGYAFIRRVRQLPSDKGGSIPALALTAYARSEDRTRAIIAGYQMHVAKPVEPSELIAMIASLAERAGKKG